MSVGEFSWFRRIALVGAVCVLLVLVILTVARLRGRQALLAHVEAEADPEAVELLMSFEKPAIPDEENAAEWVLAGAGAVVWSDVERGAVGVASGLPYSEWDQTTKATVRGALERHRGALKILGTAVSLKDSSYDIRYSDGTDAELPDLLTLMRAGRLLLCDARIAFADEDPKAGLSALATMNRMARSLYEESTLITYLIAVAIERMMLIPVAEAVSSDASWAGESAFLDSVEAVVLHTDQIGDLRRVLAAWEATLWAAVTKGVTRWEFGPEHSLDLPDDLGREDIQQARRRVEQWLPIPYGRTPERLTQLDAEAKAQEPDNGVESDLVGFNKAIGRAQSVAAQRQLIRAALTMRRTMLATGTYPIDRPNDPDLTIPDPFTDNKLSYEPGPDGTLTLAIVDVAELLVPITVAGMAQYIRPVTLPAP
ncbi:MAG: hypothetical protein KAJ78_08145 [Acidobacteria bacterium]|nr:hypothetical protein [Acidobacteriota bacterium]